MLRLEERGRMKVMARTKRIMNDNCTINDNNNNIKQFLNFEFMGEFNFKSKINFDFFFLTVNFEKFLMK